MKTLKNFPSLVIALALAVVCTAAEPVEKKPAAAPLALLGFLTANEWTATLPDGPDGKKISIHARFSWAENHQAIRVSNQFIVNGKSTPYIDGLYIWHPEKGAILFWYADAAGNLSEGSVKMEDGKLVHEFQEIHGDGKAQSLVARVTPLPNGEGWDNEILARKDGVLKPVVQVRYLADKK